MPSIRVRNISKKFEDSIAIEGISFDVQEGELLTLLGPSGSGKTTVLRLIAGLIKPDTGQILFDEKDISGIPTEERNIGFVFQSYALFPHLTVAENIAFGLETRGWSRTEKEDRVRELLQLVGLEGKGKRYPRQLSGGEQSRVALARAIAPNPSLLLLDEPLSALDVSLRENLRKAIREIQQQVKISTVYVTHDQEEAMEISDRIIILNHGRIVEVGTPRELYLQPKKVFTAQFLGISNIFSGELEPETNGFKLKTSFGALFLSSTFPGKQTNFTFAIFPERLILSTTPTKKQNEFEVTVRKVNFTGAVTSLTVEVTGIPIEVHLTSNINAKDKYQDTPLYLTIPEEAIIVLENEA
ncbi:MAG: ABC transporter ATP-binding protein [Candidatus Heimdallarchaeota archaeon]|nr:ABC transporter ATP-binding protein [Candidatus Heimdallarchaeota archaeon]